QRQDERQRREGGAVQPVADVRPSQGPPLRLRGGGGSWDGVRRRGGMDRQCRHTVGNVFGVCHGPVTARHGTKKSPPAGAYRRAGGENGSRKEGYRAAVVQTGLPSTEIDFKRVSIQGRSWLGRAATPRELARACPSVSAHKMNCTSAFASEMSLWGLCLNS